MNTTELPQGYAALCTIDLQKNKRLALGVNLGALGIAVLLFALGIAFEPFPVPADSAGDGSAALLQALLKLLAALCGIVLYLILHEAVHGIFMKGYGGLKPRFGLTLLYAYCGSDAYFDKKSYLVIGLAPVVIWGAVLLAAGLLVPEGWFWTVYLIQIVNLSGAAGDFYVTYRMLRLPRDILVQDTGVSMTVFAPAIQQ